MKNHLVFRMVLNHTVHTLMNVSPSWKFVFIQYGRIIWRYFHHLEMNYYLHQNIFPWQLSLFNIRWNRRISVIMILDVSCQLVWIFYEIIMNIIRNKKLAHPIEENAFLFTHIENNIIYMYRGSLPYFYWKEVTYQCL